MDKFKLFLGLKCWSNRFITKVKLCTDDLRKVKRPNFGWKVQSSAFEFCERVLLLCHFIVVLRHERFFFWWTEWMKQFITFSYEVLSSDFRIKLFHIVSVWMFALQVVHSTNKLLQCFMIFFHFIATGDMNKCENLLFSRRMNLPQYQVLVFVVIQFYCIFLVAWHFRYIFLAFPRSIIQNWNKKKTDEI